MVKEQMQGSLGYFSPQVFVEVTTAPARAVMVFQTVVKFLTLVTSVVEMAVHVKSSHIQCLSVFQAQGGQSSAMEQV